MALRIAKELERYRHNSARASHQSQQFASSSPLVRMKARYQQEIAEEEEHRTKILKSVSVFSSLSREYLLAAAQSLERIVVHRGEDVIVQDEIGDAFYIVEKGSLVVKRKYNSNSTTEGAQVVGRLGPNTFFGEIALLTQEPRSATVTVDSPEAILLRMTKNMFDEVMAKCNAAAEKASREVGRDVVNKVPLFQTLNAANRQKILDMMTPMQFGVGVYICRQGTVGNTFYIIVDGLCRVTINTGDPIEPEKEVAKLSKGDFFGELALIDVSGKRAANVIAMSPVKCMTLNRADFNNLLATLRSAFVEFPDRIKKNNNSTKGRGMNFVKRRISTIDDNNMRNQLLVPGYVQRICRFMLDGLFCSMYFRYFRHMAIHPEYCEVYGETIQRIMVDSPNRAVAVLAIAEKAVEIGRIDPLRRSATEQRFLQGLFTVNSALKNRICADWEDLQYISFVQNAKVSRFRAFTKICEAGSHGTTFFLILRGCVRVYTHHSQDDGKTVMKYEEDLVPGELFGETVLDNVKTRFITAQSITPCDVAIFEVTDFTQARDKSLQRAAVDDRFRFLVKTPIFKRWGKYDLYRIAPLLDKVEFNKGAVIVRKGETSPFLYFLKEGHIDIISNLSNPKDVIVTLNTNEYFGESGILTQMNPDDMKRTYREHMNIVASSFVELLVISPENYQILNRKALLVMLELFKEKKFWRGDRLADFRSEKQRVREAQREFLLECHPIQQLDGTDAQEAFMPVLQDDDPVDEALRTQILPSLDAIPVLLNSDLDPLFATATCKRAHEAKAVKDIIEKAKHRPCTAGSMLSSRRGINEFQGTIGSKVVQQIEHVREMNKEVIDGDDVRISTFDRIAMRDPTRVRRILERSTPQKRRHLLAAMRVQRQIEARGSDSSSSSDSDDPNRADDISSDSGDDEHLRVQRKYNTGLRGSARIPSTKSYCETMDPKSMMLSHPRHQQKQQPVSQQSPGAAALHALHPRPSTTQGFSRK